MSANRVLLFVAVLIAAALAGMMTQRYFFDESAEPFFNAGDLPTARPAFSIVDTLGVERSSDEWTDKALLINFWATWCAPCREEIPLLIDIQNSYAADGLQVIGVAVESDRDAVGKFAEEFGINYPVLVGEQAAMEIAEGFGIDILALPATAFSRRDGAVSAIHLGLLKPDDAKKALADTL